MVKRDRRVDAYIAKSADFARPVLEHVRALVHAACPDAEETIKWGFPVFQHHGILCGMAAFKRHCALWFWKGRRIPGLEHADTSQAMGQFGRLTSVRDLPAKRVLTGYVRAAMRLNEAGVKTPRPKPAAKPARKPAARAPAGRKATRVGRARAADGRRAC